VFRAPVERTRSALPFHYWLLFFAAGLLLMDVAVRRLAFDAEQTKEALWTTWARLRGFPLPPPVVKPEVERLRARTAGVTVTPEKAGRRFEGAGGLDAPVVASATGPVRSTTPARPATAAPGLAPEPETPVQEGGLEGLLKAKKKVWEERDKES
jgi:hypothetical protein